MKMKFIVAGILAVLAMPVTSYAQGVIRGAEEGARKGSQEGDKAAGPVGGAVGGAVGGVEGGVKGLLGIPEKGKGKNQNLSISRRSGNRFAVRKGDKHDDRALSCLHLKLKRSSRLAAGAPSVPACRDFTSGSPGPSGAFVVFRCLGRVVALQRLARGCRFRSGRSSVSGAWPPVVCRRRFRVREPKARFSLVYRR